MKAEAVYYEPFVSNESEINKNNNENNNEIEEVNAYDIENCIIMRIMKRIIKKYLKEMLRKMRAVMIMRIMKRIILKYLKVMFMKTLSIAEILNLKHGLIFSMVVISFVLTALFHIQGENKEVESLKILLKK